MALYLPAFFLSPAWQVILLHFASPVGWLYKATEKREPPSFILLLPSPTIQEDDLPRMPKSRKMTYRVQANSGL
jgi:hypothetical protein